MNVIYLHSHDTGRMVQPYGYAVRTPHLQQLAETGVLFRQAFCAAPTCSPSRAALLTGEYAHQSGMVGLVHRGARLTHPERHLAHFLAGHGFDTAVAGVNHVGDPESCGYTHVSPGEKNDSEATVSFALDFLRQRDPDRPFFLDVGFHETHRTEAVCQGFNRAHHAPKDGDGDPAHVRPPDILGDSPAARRDWLDFVFSVERLDGYYGRVLAAVEELGLTEDTLIVATTDHGIAFPWHKCSLTQHGTGVLLILRGPGGFQGGRTTDALVSHLDLYPTLCEVLGLPAPAWLQGKSLRPLIEGNAEEHHAELFAEVTFHAAFEPKRGVRTRRWSYLCNFAAPHPTVRPNCDDGHTKRRMLAHGWGEQIVPVEELYDLALDPLERRNVAADPRNAAALAEMRARLATWMQRTDDPLLQPDPGSLPLPLRANPWSHDQPNQPSGNWDPAEWDRIRHAVPAPDDPPLG